ncbi:MAG TPA: cytochrome d ubiquinol oxidase subunit II [Candidatus Acidoferrales bacterium]|jgi:cytochrome d ubiquinol oxidase subunit II|nr:cytochrome d ubiquinol oxidase subunit II [Candidatus Acidoferrales bacterium]
MNAVWFWVLGGMLTAYAVLDGYDLGVGALHLWLARTNTERRIALNAIGPVWNGNEVWLIAAGGMMVVSFPRVYASGFSGFYLALMIVLWLLIARGVSIELRGQVDHPLWRSLWDTGFWFGSALLALLLGVALGNILRGLPIGADGYFQGTFALLLNPYSLLTGALSFVVLVWHGANYLRMKTEGGLQQRAQDWSSRAWWAVAALVVITSVATFGVRPTLTANFHAYPWAWTFPLLAAAGLASSYLCRRRDRDRGAFRSSTLAIVGLMGSAAATVYPNLLTSTLDPAYSLTIYNAASSPLALRSSLIANLVGMFGVAVYSIYVHRTFRGKVRLRDHGY